ncbi:MAG TPA: OmpA family protein, partial [Bacteroidales bacterium]|nr:OmpA family protein [Bacteroidales bacterium]
GEPIFIDRDTTGADGVYSFNLLPDKNYTFEMEGFQYFNEEIHLSTEMITFSYTIDMPPIWVNILPKEPIELENIYYEFDKANLTDEAKESIDTTLLAMMNEIPNIIVEVGSHTDGVGGKEYNKNLSQDRADNVIAYLISKGIEPSRLVAKGYGDEKPIAPNKNPDGSDNPEGREKNRRTEFRIIGTMSTVQGDPDEEY